MDPVVALRDAKPRVAATFLGGAPVDDELL
eukprot:COSAG06_NODE_5414_length_3498_cov_136.488185_4_plen_29_part_01